MYYPMCCSSPAFHSYMEWGCTAEGLILCCVQFAKETSFRHSQLSFRSTFGVKHLKSLKSEDGSFNYESPASAIDWNTALETVWRRAGSIVVFRQSLLSMVVTPSFLRLDSRATEGFIQQLSSAE